MAATTFNLGKGAVLSLSPDGTTFTPVKQLKTISFSGDNANYEDITNMDSPSAVQEFAPTTTSSGTAAISGVFLDGDPGQLMLAASKVAQTLMHVKVQFAPKVGQSSGFLRTFSAYVMECNGPDAQFDKASTLSATLKISGVKTDTPGAV